MLLCKHNQFMRFLRWFLSRRSNADWTTWRSMIITLPCVVGLLFTAYDATHENSAAKRQQTSEGLVISYIRSNHSRCGYTFSVHGKQYSGTASAPTDHVTVGDRVIVYFDSQEPTTNSLEDFSQMRHRNQSFAYILIAMIIAVAGFMFISKTASAPPKRRSTAP